MSKIVGIGANVLDTLIHIPFFPNEDTKLESDRLMHCGGGPCATGLVAAARLGAHCAYIGNLADDSEGHFLKTDLEQYGVSTEHTKLLAGYSSFSSYILINGKNASRTCVFHPGDVPPLVLSEEQKKTIKDADVLLVDGNELNAAIDGAKLARENGVRVLYDAGSLYEGVECLLSYTDILIPSEEFALRYTGENDAKSAAKMLMERFRPEAVVITQGVFGGVLSAGGKIRSYSSFPVQAVETNGAGDVFHGAFAFGLTEGFDFYQCCVFSSAVSAIKCTGFGARRSVPDYQTVQKFLKERGCDVFKEELE